MTPKEQKLIDSLFKKIQEAKDNIAYATERLNKYKESIAVASCPFQVGNFVVTDTGACSKHGAQVKAIVPSRFFSPSPGGSLNARLSQPMGWYPTVSSECLKEILLSCEASDMGVSN